MGARRQNGLTELLKRIVIETCESALPAWVFDGNSLCPDAACQLSSRYRALQSFPVQS